MNDATHSPSKPANDTVEHLGNTSVASVALVIESAGRRCGAVVEMVDNGRGYHFAYIYASSPVVAATAKRSMLALMRTLPVHSICHLNDRGRRTFKRNGLACLGLQFIPSQELAS